jgi:hypothetical protein
MAIPTQGELKIVIEMQNADNGSGESISSTPSPAKPKNEATPQQSPTGGGKNQAWLATSMRIAGDIGKQALSNAVSTIGIATGNYRAQSQAELAITASTQLIGYAAMAATGNWAMLGVSIASSAISYATENYTQQKEREIQNFSAEQYAKRIGYTRDRK